MSCMARGPYLSLCIHFMFRNFIYLNPLNGNFTKWSNTLKQFVGNLPTNCLNVFYHFVGLALKRLIKNDPNIKGIEIFEYFYLYTAYADNTTFFLKDKNFIVDLSEKFKLFFDFSGLKPNTTKCEIGGIGVLKGVQVAVSGMKCTDLKMKLSES